jgi:hypothetical protein
MFLCFPTYAIHYKCFSKRGNVVISSSSLPMQNNKHTTTKDILEKINQTMCLFIRNLIKDVSFVFEKYRVHKYIWLETINFG